MQSPSSNAVIPQHSTTITTSAAEWNTLLCKYPTKKCSSLRAVKSNGELHSLCMMHRIRANRNQRAMEERRRRNNAASSESLMSMRKSSHTIILKQFVYVRRDETNSSADQVETSTSMAYVVPNTYFTDLLLSDITTGSNSNTNTPVKMGDHPAIHSNNLYPSAFASSNLSDGSFEENLDELIDYLEDISAHEFPSSVHGSPAG